MNTFDDLFDSTQAQAQPQLSKEDYAARKQTERDQYFTLSDNAASKVASSGEYFQEYLNVQSTFSRYSAVNALLIYAQQQALPSGQATRLGDFDYWKDRGCYVKKKSVISILEPHEYTKEDGTPGTGYNIKKMFDISQLDKHKIKASTPPARTERQLLQALISKAPMKISGVDELPGNLCAMTNPETGEISVRRGMEFADTFKSVAQELCYAEVQNSGNQTAAPEFASYCGAYLLCKKHGVDTRDFDFYSSPALFQNHNPQNIKQELSTIRDAADSVSGRMARQLGAQEKAEKSKEAR